MGARIEARDGRFPPFTVHGARLRGIEYELPVASAQVKSCVLLAGLVADGDDGRRAGAERATTPSGCCCAPAPRVTASARDGARIDDRRNVDELELDRDRRSPATCRRPPS